MKDHYYLVYYKAFVGGKIHEGNMDLKTQGPISISHLNSVKQGIQKLFVPNAKLKEILLVNIMPLGEPVQNSSAKPH